MDESPVMGEAQMTYLRPRRLYLTHLVLDFLHDEHQKDFLDLMLVKQIVIVGIIRCLLKIIITRWS
jgi:hypothetical protein